MQLTVYLGKRDFVDHLDHVDPVGESGLVCVCFGVFREYGCCCAVLYLQDCLSSFLPTDGVILVDPEYLKDRKGRREHLHTCTGTR